MNEIEALGDRVSAIERMIVKHGDRFTLDFADDVLNDARFMALYSIVQDIAQHLGISPDQFRMHFLARQRFWHQHGLQSIESRNPSLAAEIDRRPTTSAGTDESYPSIFDPPPSE